MLEILHLTMTQTTWTTDNLHIVETKAPQNYTKGSRIDLE